MPIYLGTACAKWVCPKPITQLFAGKAFRRWLATVGLSVANGEAKTLFEAIQAVKNKWDPWLLRGVTAFIEDATIEGEPLAKVIEAARMLSSNEINRIRKAEKDGNLHDVLTLFSPDFSPSEGKIKLVELRNIFDPIVLILTSPIHRLLFILLKEASLQKVDSLMFVRISEDVFKLRAMAGDNALADFESPPPYIMGSLKNVVLIYARIPYWIKTEASGLINSLPLPCEWKVKVFSDGALTMERL